MFGLILYPSFRIEIENSSHRGEWFVHHFKSYLDVKYRQIFFRFLEMWLQYFLWSARVAESSWCSPTRSCASPSWPWASSSTSRRTPAPHRTASWPPSPGCRSSPSSPSSSSSPSATDPSHGWWPGKFSLMRERIWAPRFPWLSTGCASFWWRSLRTICRWRSRCPGLSSSMAPSVDLDAGSFWCFCRRQRARHRKRWNNTF